MKGLLKLVSMPIWILGKKLVGKMNEEEVNTALIRAGVGAWICTALAVIDVAISRMDNVLAIVAFGLICFVAILFIVSALSVLFFVRRDDAK